MTSLRQLASRTPLRRCVSACVAVGTAALSSPAATAAPKMPQVAFGIERCVPTVLAKYPGDALQVLLKVEDGAPVWEVEVEAKDGRLYDVECSGKTGKIVETEERFKSADAAPFAAKAKVSAADATRTALAKHPGTVEQVEFEVESDGTPVYEFDIELADGSDIRVEVDAVTGKLRAAKAELVEVGRIPK
jgi:uncharacterized membrane protein YkoI